jgi:hypothetical protein
MRYYVCQASPESPPFVAMLDDAAHARMILAIGGGKSRRSYELAVKFAFGTACQYAAITATEFFAALRAAGGNSPPDSGSPARLDPIKPKPGKPPRGGMAARVYANAGVAA